MRLRMGLATSDISIAWHKDVVEYMPRAIIVSANKIAAKRRSPKVNLDFMLL